MEEIKNPASVTMQSDSSINDTPAGSQVDLKASRGIYEKVYNFFGFTKGYNFPLWIIFAGAMFGFCLSRLEDFNYDKYFAFNIGASYMYYFHGGHYKAGMIMHLAGVIPAGLLMVLQFTPVLRHRYITLHRINGYLVIALLFVGNLGAALALGHNDSGTRVATQSVEVLLVIMTTIGMGMAYYNIKRLQIDQHRAWMLRTMFWFGAVVTTRIVLHIGILIMPKVGNYYTVWSCDVLDYMYSSSGFPGILEKKWPQCLQPNGTLDGQVVVKAAWNLQEPEMAVTDFNILFGPALWISLALNAIGIEIYLALTPQEARRLRQVSFERALAAGMKNPGNTGTTAQKWGDAEAWSPKSA